MGWAKGRGGARICGRGLLGNKPLPPQKPLLSLEETLNVTEGNFHQLVALLHCRSLNKVTPHLASPPNYFPLWIPSRDPLIPCRTLSSHRTVLHPCSPPFCRETLGQTTWDPAPNLSLQPRMLHRAAVQPLSNSGWVCRGPGAPTCNLLSATTQIIPFPCGRCHPLFRYYGVSLHWATWVYAGYLAPRHSCSKEGMTPGLRLQDERQRTQTPKVVWLAGLAPDSHKVCTHRPGTSGTPIEPPGVFHRATTWDPHMGDHCTGLALFWGPKTQNFWQKLA